MKYAIVDHVTPPVARALNVNNAQLAMLEEPRESETRPVAVDLFAGCGGLSLGFHRAGFDVAAALEYDPVHAATHLYNFPDCAMLCRDARFVKGSDLVAAARAAWEHRNPLADWPGVDVVIGGPPCQGFSSGGRRDATDERNDLILQFVRLVEEIAPRAFCMENVAGFLEPRHKAVREEAIRRLRAADYVITGHTETVNVRDYGVPQSRRRVVLLGARGVAPRMPAGSEQRVTVAQALEGLPTIEKYAELLESDATVLDQADCDNLQNPASDYARSMVSTTAPAPSSWDRSIITGARRTRHSEETRRRFGSTEQGAVEPKSRLFRLNNDAQARTIRAGSGSERGSHTSPRPIHPTLSRAITVREAARLQSFPDWFRFHTTNWHGHRQVGNSVPPRLAEVAANALLDALDIAASSPTPLSSGDESLLSLNRTQAASLLGALEAEIPPARRRGASPGQEEPEINDRLVLEQAADRQLVKR